MKKKGNKYKITSEEIRKMEKAVERELRLDQGEYRPTSVHKTSKKDINDKHSNNIKNWEE